MDARLRRLRRVARTLAAERVTVEVANAFEQNGIQHIFLKGPIFARWLYEDPHERDYGDTDVLVSPADFDEAERVLQGLGFRPHWHLEFEGKRSLATRGWARPSHGGQVDLHRTLWGVGSSPQMTWAALSDHVTEVEVKGTPIRALDDIGNTFHAALHAAQHGKRVGKPQKDLELVLQRTSLDRWNEVVALADRLHATEWLSSGLRLVSQGRAIAARLDLPTAVSPTTALRHETAPLMAETLIWLEGLGSWRARISYIVRALFPPASGMETTILRADRGRIGLLLAYPVRWWFLLRLLPRALVAWRKARRGARLDD